MLVTMSLTGAGLVVDLVGIIVVGFVVVMLVVVAMVWCCIARVVLESKQGQNYGRASKYSDTVVTVPWAKP